MGAALSIRVQSQTVETPALRAAWCKRGTRRPRTPWMYLQNQQEEQALGCFSNLSAVRHQMRE